MANQLMTAKFDAYSVDRLLQEKLLHQADAALLRPVGGGEQSDKEAIKEAERSAQHIGRKVKALDEVTSGVKKRYQDAKDNLERLKYEHDNKTKNIAFMEEARNALARQLEDKRQKTVELSGILRREEKRMEQVMKDMQVGARVATLTGVQDLGALRHGLQGSVMSQTSTGPMVSMRPKDVQTKFFSQTLSAERGYHCNIGSTAPARFAKTSIGFSQSMPTLKR